jgi:uncharacterized protein
MPAFFLDTSAIVKRYFAEVGSAWVVELTDLAAGHQIHLARITGVEVASAMTRQGRAGNVTPEEAARLLAAFRFAFANDFRIVPVSPRVLVRAMNLAEAHALRGCDAVQLAAALHANRARKRPMPFVSADVALNAAAAAEGLPVDDPNAHP